MDFVERGRATSSNEQRLETEPAVPLASVAAPGVRVTLPPVWLPADVSPAVSLTAAPLPELTEDDVKVKPFEPVVTETLVLAAREMADVVPVI